jgi:hypothetical protein
MVEDCLRAFVTLSKAREYRGFFIRYTHMEVSGAERTYSLLAVTISSDPICNIDR